MVFSGKLVSQDCFLSVSVKKQWKGNKIKPISSARFITAPTKTWYSILCNRMSSSPNYSSWYLYIWVTLNTAVTTGRFLKNSHCLAKLKASQTYLWVNFCFETKFDCLLLISRKMLLARQELFSNEYLLISKLDQQKNNLSEWHIMRVDAELVESTFFIVFVIIIIEL